MRPHVASLRAVAATLIGTVLLAGCPGSGDSGGGVVNPGGGGTTTPAKVASVAISPATATLEPTRTQQLATVVTDTKGQTVTNATLVWASSSPAVAVVSGSGLVTAIADGTAIVTATSSDGPSGTATITVRTKVAAVTVTPPTNDLVVGGQGAQLTATVKAGDGRTLSDRPVTWSSSSATVATVSSSGLVIAVAAGTATITATAEGVAGSATVTVTVDPCLVVRSIAVGQSANGTLANTDCRLSDNSSFHKYQFTLAALATVEITMTSTQVDPYLLLVNSANIVVDEDDDGGGGTSARLLRELPPGRYTVYANTFAEKEYGTYALSVREAPTPCTTLRPVTLPQTVNGTLSTTNSCRRNDGSYEDRYALTVTSRTTVSISMTSSAVDPVLTVIDSKQKIWGQDDDSGTGLNAYLEVALDPGTYTIQGRGYPGETGAYRLEVKTAVDPCAVSRTIAVGGSATGTITSADCPLTDGQGGPSYYTQRYNLTLTTATRVQIDLTSTQFDAYLILQNSAGTVVASNDDASDATTNARLSPTLAAGQYVINATTYEAGETGSYALAVTSLTATPVTITVTPTTATLQAGQTQQATATVSGTTNTAVLWSSSASAIASVTTTGLIRGVTAGSATVTAASVADPSKTASVTVTVPTQTTSTTNLDIAAMYLVQVTQQQDGRVPLVAGRDAVARVFVRGNRTGLSAATVRLRVYDGATLVSTATATATPTTAIDESCCSANFILPAAMIKTGAKVLADVDPTNTVAETNETDNQFPLDGTPQTLNVRTAPALNVRFVSVVQNRNGLRGTPTNAMATELRTFWPLSTVNATARTNALAIDYVLDASRVDDIVRLVRDVETARRADNFSGYYYGLFTYRSTSGIVGLANGIPARSAIGIDETTPFGPSESRLTFVHELGHTFGLRHAPCGGAAGPEPTFPNADGSTGNWGMNTTVSPLVLMPPTRTDVMGYCDNQWVGAFNYRKVMDFREANPNGTGLQSETAMLLVTGGITAGRAELDVALSLSGAPDGDDPEGRFILEGFDAAGRRLFAQRFTPHAVSDASLGTEGFVVAVPLAAKVQAQLERLAVRELAGARTATKVKPATMLQTSTGVQITSAMNGGARLVWAGGATPVTFVRDRTTRQIIAISREGALDLPATIPLDQLELLVSNGVTSTTYTIDPVTRQVRQ